MTSPSADRDPGDLRQIEIDGDVVRRPAHPWTPTVHAFLRHLRAQGLDCVPDPRSIEGDVETVSYLPGASGRDGWFAQHSSAGLTSAARLLRIIHDASRGWSPPEDARWSAPGVPGDDQVMCHGDPGPWNFVWDGDHAIGLIDWDFLHPGPRLDDVTYALRWFAPARSDEHALEWHHFPEVPDRRQRIRDFVEAYGDLPACHAPAFDVPAFDLPAFDVVDAMASRVERTVRIATDLAEQGIEPQRTWVAEGDLDIETDDARWIREHRHLLE